MNPIEIITELLQLSAREDRHFPATDLYNEGWLLRLVLDWFSGHRHDVEKASASAFPMARYGTQGEC